MGRTRLRTLRAAPVLPLRVQQWFGNKRHAKQALGLERLSDEAFWRVLRCDLSAPSEVTTIEKAAKEYGRQHKLAGWEDI